MRTSVILLILVCATTASAQEADTTRSGSPAGDAVAGLTPRSSRGDMALLFDVGGLAELALQSFTTGPDTVASATAGFGGKVFLEDRLALRLALLVDWRSVTIPRGTDTLPTTDELSSLRLGIAPAVTYNLVMTGPVAGYVGGLLEYQWMRGSRVLSDPVDPDVTSTGSLFGISLLVGAEWFPWSHVSVAAEYRLGYAHSSSERELTHHNEPTTRLEEPSESTVTLGSRGTVTAALYW